MLTNKNDCDHSVVREDVFACMYEENIVWRDKIYVRVCIVLRD